MLRLVPGGILHPGKVAVIGNGLVVDPLALLEIEQLVAAGSGCLQSITHQQPRPGSFALSPP